MGDPSAAWPVKGEKGDGVLEKDRIIKYVFQYHKRRQNKRVSCLSRTPSLEVDRDFK